MPVVRMQRHNQVLNQSFRSIRPIQDAVIVRAIIAMADSLGFSTIAEGVETEPQRQFLSEQGCYHYQGYLFSHPLLGNDLSALLEQ